MSPCFWRLWALYLSATWSVYIPLCEFNWLLIFAADFFSGWILLRSTKEIKGFFFFSKLVWNLIEQEWVEQRPSVLSCAAYLLCVLLHLMNIQSCTGSLSGFQSLSFFRFPSLATALFSHLHKDTRIQKNTHINVPHWHNSCLKGNLILAPAMNIHSHLLPAESF